MAVADASVASRRARVPQRARSGGRRLTTPGSLRLASVALALGLVALGVVGARAATERRHAAGVVGADATPLLVRAEELYVALADADAAASTAFLEIGPDSSILRSRYVDDIDRAADRVASIAGQRVLSDEGRQSVAEIIEGLPVYTEQVEAARINTRLGHSVGAAYLRRASDSMRSTMLPAATQVYKEAARQLYTAYGRGTSRTGTSVVLIVAGTVVTLLVLAQVLVSVRTRRLLNVGLLGATALVVALGVWAALTLHSQQASLLRSQREGSDQLIVLSTARASSLSSPSAPRAFTSSSGEPSRRTSSTSRRSSRASALPTGRPACWER